ncbi:MAG: hypothetical protein FWE67_05950 [Planctomycetaceae bacterium]|nr:hypothetical protein [Planctomycetaceae bacterium]
MENFNFFSFIRDGVRRSVLGGVEDAVQTLGLPPESDSTKSVLFKNLLTDDTVDASTPRKITASRGGQSKLGRGIGDLQPVKEV